MNYYISHSAKGTTWSNHKYIAIKNGRYIYDTAKKKAKYGAIYSKGWVKEKVLYKPLYKLADPNGQYFGRSRSTSMVPSGPFQSMTGNAGSGLNRGLKASRERAEINTTNRKPNESAPQLAGRGYRHITDRTGELDKKKKAIARLRKFMNKKVKDL